MGARGRVWMHVCAGLASGECRGKAAGSGCFGGAMTLNVFVIFWRFESQGEWNSSTPKKKSVFMRVPNKKTLLIFRIKLENR